MVRPSVCEDLLDGFGIETMKHHCTIYNKSTGEIVQYSSFTCQEDVEQIARNYYGRLLFFGVDEYDFIEAETDPLSQYVVMTGNEVQAIPRPLLVVKASKTALIANGTDTITLSGLPNPCTIVKDLGEPEEEAITVEGGGFVFSADDPGLYRFRIERFPFLPLDLEFTAT